MQLVRASDEKGVTIPAPYERTIRILLAPDRGDVPEVMVSAVEIPPGSHTDYHDHDRPELIYVISGAGIGICEGRELGLHADAALWVLAGEKHEVRNTGHEVMKLVTVFVPGYTAESAYETCLRRAKQG